MRIRIHIYVYMTYTRICAGHHQQLHATTTPVPPSTIPHNPGQTWIEGCQMAAHPGGKAGEVALICPLLLQNQSPPPPVQPHQTYACARICPLVEPTLHVKVEPVEHSIPQGAPARERIALSSSPVQESWRLAVGSWRRPWMVGGKQAVVGKWRLHVAVKRGLVPTGTIG